MSPRMRKAILFGTKPRVGKNMHGWNEYLEIYSLINYETLQILSMKFKYYLKLHNIRLAVKNINWYIIEYDHQIISIWNV